MLNQMNVYSHVIAEKIEKNEFHGQNLADAQALQASTANLAQSIDEDYRTEIENQIGAQEALLGI